MDDRASLYNTFNEAEHLKASIDKRVFDSLHLWDLGWAILEPINIAGNDDEEKLLSTRLSPGQKLLYFFWYIDAQVTNDGFIEFYYNGYRQYLPPILDGLRLINDKDLEDLILKADQLYISHQDQFDIQRRKKDSRPLYRNLNRVFDELDDRYEQIHDHTMNLIEQYIRRFPAEFINVNEP